jgi:hypothetical protein
MISIEIIEEHSFGHPNKDKSIDVPETGDIGQLVDDAEIPKTDAPKVTTFYQHIGCSVDATGYRSFPAVEMNPWYMLWISERGEWVGIKFDYQGFTQEPDGNNEWIETAGPFKLNQKCAELIRQAYKTNVPLEKVLCTPPEKLTSQT